MFEHYLPNKNEHVTIAPKSKFNQLNTAAVSLSSDARAAADSIHVQCQLSAHRRVNCELAFSRSVHVPVARSLSQLGRTRTSEGVCFCHEANQKNQAAFSSGRNRRRRKSEGRVL